MNDVQNIAITAHAALSALNNPTSTPSAISGAQATLEQIKHSLTPVTVIPVAERLLSPILSTPAPPHSRQLQLHVPHIHYGFHIVDELVFRAASPWSSFPDEVRSSIRRLSVLVVQKISQVDQEGNAVDDVPQLIIEKAVAFLSSVAIREWPQRWPDFLDRLLADTPRADIACHVLRVLSEDVHDFPDIIAPSRRQELHQAMALTLPQTLNYIIASADKYHVQKRYDALRPVLTCLESFISWASMHALFAACAPQACLTLLENRETRLPALSALRVLVGRQFASTEVKPNANDPQSIQLRTVQCDSAFRDIVFSGLLKFSSSRQVLSIVGPSLLVSVGVMPGLRESRNLPQKLDDIDDEEYGFLVIFFTMLSELGGCHFTSSFQLTISSKEKPMSESSERCGAAFIELMLAAATCPSLAIRSTVLSFVVSALSWIEKHKKTDAVTGLGYFLATGYVHAGALGLLQFSDDKMSVLLDELDYGGDRRRQKEALDSFRARTISCLGLTCKHVPQLGSTAGLRRMSFLLSNPISSDQNGKGADNTEPVNEGSQDAAPRFLKLIVSDNSQHGWKFGGFEQMSYSQWVSALGATIVATEAMMAGVTASGILDSQRESFELMQSILAMVLNITEDSLLSSKASALKIFVPLYMKNPEALKSAIKSLIAQISLYPNTNNARFRACSALSTICRRLGNAKVKTLEQLRQPLCEYTAQVLASSQFQPVYKIFMLEASIDTVLVIDDVPEQANWIDKLMTPIVEILCSDEVGSVLDTPISFFQFVTSADARDVDRVAESFQVVENCAQQVVKPLAKPTARLDLNSALSRYIAPKSVEASSRLMFTLHGMYNSSKFPLDDTTGTRESILYPTSREISSLLNLEAISYKAQNFIQAEFGDDRLDLQNEVSGEQQSEELLRQFGIEPPDPKYSGARETLKILRRSAYDIMRSAILSGVTRSHSHLNILLQATCADCRHIEPIHLLDLTNKVLRPLLSFSVVCADPSFLEILAQSEIHVLLNIIQEHVERAKLEETQSSSVATLDVTRDHGRKKLARAASDMIYNMYPRLELQETKKVDVGVGVSNYVPQTFNYASLSTSVIGLWKTLCSPGRGFLDNGAARVAFGTVVNAVQLAPENRFQMFAPLLLASIQTAVENDGLGVDSPLENAIGAALSIVRKWPNDSETELCRELEKYGSFMTNWVKETIATIHGPEHVRSKQKKHRSWLRALTGKIAEAIGVSQRVKSKVHALPEKLVANNPLRNRNRVRPESEDLLLGDQALDSLFGEGEPL